MTTAKPNPYKGYTLSSFHYNVDEFQSKTVKLIPSNYSKGSHFRYIKSKTLRPFTALILTVLSINTTHAALSATSAQTIKGTAPYFTLNGTPLGNTAELIGFKFGSTVIDASKSTQATPGSIITIPAGVTEGDLFAAVDFNLAIATPLQTLIQTPSDPLKVSDSDGDASTISSTSATGNIKATFTKDGVPVPSGSTATFAPCANYQIEVEVTGSGTPATVSAQTTYGDPNTSITGTYYASKATYKLNGQGTAICYIKPGDMTVYANRTAAASKFPTLGYNPATWEAGQGFKVSAGFPTTGFKGAVFSIIGSGGDQRYYKCTLTGGTGVSLSAAPATAALGKGCQVTYGATKPGAYTITMFDTFSGTDVAIGNYYVRAPTLWAWANQSGGGSVYPKYNSLNNFMGSYPAAEACGMPAWFTGLSAKTTASGYFFRRNELTNTPVAYQPASSSASWNGGIFARDADTTFTGEWGKLNNYVSIWNTARPQYWVGDDFNQYTAFIVTADGTMSNFVPDWTQVTNICRG